MFKVSNLVYSWIVCAKARVIWFHVLISFFLFPFSFYCWLPTFSFLFFNALRMQVCVCAFGSVKEFNVKGATFYFWPTINLVSFFEIHLSLLCCLLQIYYVVVAALRCCYWKNCAKIKTKNKSNRFLVNLEIKLLTWWRMSASR